MGLETGIECNTTNLLLNDWSGLWIEASSKNVDIIKKFFKIFRKKFKSPLRKNKYTKC